MYSPPKCTHLLTRCYQKPSSRINKKNVARHIPPPHRSHLVSPPNNVVFRKDGTAKNPRLLRATKKLQNPFPGFPFPANLQPPPAKVPPPSRFFPPLVCFFFPRPISRPRTKMSKQHICSLRLFFVCFGAFAQRSATQHIQPPHITGTLHPVPLHFWDRTRTPYIKHSPR